MSYATQDKRRHRRLGFHSEAVVVTDDALRPCRLIDISESGVRLSIDHPDEVPHRFTLLLTRMGKVRRRCRLIWRSDKEIGAQFVRPTVARKRPRFPPVPSEQAS